MTDATSKLLQRASLARTMLLLTFVAAGLVGSDVASAAEIGVYRGAGRADRVAKWADTYRVNPTVVLDYTKRFWNPNGTFMRDKIRRWNQTDYRVSYGITPRWNDLGRYGRLARVLPPETLVRLGWEFNGPWNYYSADPERFAAHWRAVVDTMRAERDDLLFEWVFASDSADPRPYWPGAEYVDVIGIDIYNVKGWWQHLAHPHGPRLHLALAEQYDKPMSFPEWGLVAEEHGGKGDNPKFIRQMANWIRQHDDRVLYHAYFDFHCCLSDHRLKSYPRSARAFVDAFS